MTARPVPLPAPGNTASPVDAPADARATRVISRHALPAFTSWQPLAFDEPEVAPPTREEIDTEVAVARQRGYDQGYGEGVAAQKALDDDRAQQAHRQMGDLLRAFDAELSALEVEMAQTLARAATRLAREVLRAELATKPEHVAALARDAVDAMLASARHLVVKVHPQDVDLVEHGAGDVIHARGGRIVADAALERGSVLVTSDIGAVDATLAARWRDATAALSAPAWDEGHVAGTVAAADAADTVAAAAAAADPAATSSPQAHTP